MLLIDNLSFIKKFQENCAKLRLPGELSFDDCQNIFASLNIDARDLFNQHNALLLCKKFDDCIIYNNLLTEYMYATRTYCKLGLAAQKREENHD